MSHINQRHTTPLLYHASRILIGATFLVSALAKAIDPYGTLLKLEEYFAAASLSWLNPASGVLATALICLEGFLAVALLSGAWKRFAARITLIVSTLFTLLTLWVVIFNPVAECGCFGDVIPLSNEATFTKNILLTALAIILLRHCPTSGNSCRWAAIGTLGATLALAFVVVWSLLRLPLVDLFPFKVGVNLRAEYEQALEHRLNNSRVVCRNLKSGHTESFLASDPTWWDESEWEYVTMEFEEEEATIEVKIDDFRVFSRDVDLTGQLLDMPMCRLFVAENVERLTTREREKMSRLMLDCIGRGERVVLLTASSIIRAATLFPGIERANMDAVTLRTLLRAPSGVVTLRNGTIEHKTTLWALK
ncbi:MAG: hypothetical protein II323_04250 [Tidjanibacter sp.]|nr:hypothetical protein [Tidjanibacter sp.]